MIFIFEGGGLAVILMLAKQVMKKFTTLNIQILVLLSLIKINKSIAIRTRSSLSSELIWKVVLEHSFIFLYKYFSCIPVSHFEMQYIAPFFNSSCCDS